MRLCRPNGPTLSYPTLALLLFVAELWGAEWHKYERTIARHFETTGLAHATARAQPVSERMNWPLEGLRRAKWRAWLHTTDESFMRGLLRPACEPYDCSQRQGTMSSAVAEAKKKREEALRYRDSL